MSNGTLPTSSQPPPLVQSDPGPPPPQPTSPSTYPPSPHGTTHIDPTLDLVPVVTTSTPGLAPQLSNNPNTWLNGQGVYTTPPGTPLNLKGTVATSSALPSTGNALNDFWVASDTGHGWAWNGTAWVDMGPFQGPPGVAGPAGTTGPPGSTGPTGQGYTWLGAWSSVTAYVPYQTVSYQGSSYVCIAGNTNQLPTNTTYWNIIAQIGSPGAPGSTGATGPPGSAGGAGPQGQPGQPAYSLTTAQVTIPAAGTTTTVTLSSVSWANVGDYVSVQGAAGSGQSAVLQITAINTGTNTLTLLNPPQGGGIPPASNSQAGLLNQLSGNVSDFVDGTNTCQNLVTAIQPVIWSARLRSYNAIGNPTFEVMQRNIGNSLTNPAHGTPIEDRWQALNLNLVNPIFQVATLVAPRNVPGTAFGITKAYMRMVVGTVKSSLAANDVVGIQQIIEGPRWRELVNDVHSLSIFLRSNVNCKLGVSLRDSGPPTKSLTKLVTLTANTDTLVQLPALPVFPSGNFTMTAGSASYVFVITLAAGSTYISPANDTWQSGNFIGAAGQDNYLANPVNSEVDVFFVQHEPGPLCTMPIDCPFGANLDGDFGCMRYFQKSYPYGVAPGTVNTAGAPLFTLHSTLSNQLTIPIRFPKIMAKSPTVTGYNPRSGAINSVQDENNSAARTISATLAWGGDSGFSGFLITGGVATPIQYSFHYTADTGW